MPKSTTYTESKTPSHNIPPSQLRFFVCTDHDFKVSRDRGSYIVARDEQHARELLSYALIKSGLQPWEQYRFNLREVDITKPFAEVLVVGDGI